MKIKVSEIFERFEGEKLLIKMVGDDQTVVRMAPVEECRPGDLVFVDHPKYLQRVISQRPSVVVTSEVIASELISTGGVTVLIAPNIRLAIALLKQAYDDRDVRNTEWPRIHPSAVVHETVSLPDDAVIGPGVVIGQHVTLGSRVVLMANVVVEHDASIGSETVVHPGAVIGYGSRIGSHVILKAGCVIGSEGFGFAQDEQRRNYRIPHTGCVVIEDRVVIGANTNIDRATYGETRVGRGAVIDAMCHLGHNVEIGEDCILCAHTGISGSTKFGKRVIASGQTGTLDHVTVADDVVLLHRAGLNNSIKEPGMYAGGPTQPLAQYLKNMAVMPKLYDMWSRLKKLEKKIDALSQG
jgi:UDP-3-O-[3-hydroxymyristoyl] glucosamine N-acyltransferase